MKGTADHLYLVYHRVDDAVMAMPCIGDEELLVHGKLVENMGIEIVRILDLEYDLDKFMTRILYEGLVQRWEDDHPE